MLLLHELANLIECLKMFKNNYWGSLYDNVRDTANENVFKTRNYYV